MIRLLNTEVTIPAWALFMALLVVSAVAVWLTSPSTMAELGRRAVQEGVIR